MKTNKIMPTYEQLAVWLAKSEQEKSKLVIANERLKNKRPVTTTKIVSNPEGYMVCICILSFFIIAVSAVLINEKYGLL